MESGVRQVRVGSRRRRRGAGNATLVLVGILVLGACAGSVREGLIAKGATPAYADGYQDGCASGKAAGGGLFDSPAKDAGRYGGEADYTKGWDDAFASCKATMDQMVHEARIRKSKGDN